MTNVFTSGDETVVTQIEVDSLQKKISYDPRAETEGEGGGGGQTHKVLFMGINNQLL